MTPEQFCYWLQGFAEITGANVGFGSNPQPHEWEVIKDHLALVFKKETPSYTFPALTADELKKKIEGARQQLDPKWPHFPINTTFTC